MNLGGGFGLRGGCAALRATRTKRIANIIMREDILKYIAYVVIVSNLVKKMVFKDTGKFNH